MAKYEVIHTKYFKKDFSKLDAVTQRRVLINFEKLRSNPRIGEKLKSKEIGVWKIRIGDYRIRYDIENKKVILYFVKHRSKIYN